MIKMAFDLQVSTFLLRDFVGLTFESPCFLNLLPGPPRRLGITHYDAIQKQRAAIHDTAMGSAPLEPQLCLGTTNVGLAAASNYYFSLVVCVRVRSCLCACGGVRACLCARPRVCAYVCVWAFVSGCACAPLCTRGCACINLLPMASRDFSITPAWLGRRRGEPAAFRNSGFQAIGPPEGHSGHQLVTCPPAKGVLVT